MGEHDGLVRVHFWRGDAFQHLRRYEGCWLEFHQRILGECKHFPSDTFAVTGTLRHHFRDTYVPLADVVEFDRTW